MTKEDFIDALEDYQNEKILYLAESKFLYRK